MTQIPKIVAHFETSLASKITAAAATASLVSVADKAGVSLSGYVGVTIDEGTATEEECLGTLSGTTLTFALRGLDPQNPTLEVTALKFQHRRGASVKITDAPILAIVRGLLNGELSLPSKLIYATNLSFSDDKELIPKKYADDLAIAGAPDASTTAKGISKMSVAPASPTSPISVGDNDPRVPTQAENDAMVGSSGSPSSSNKFITENDVAAASAASKIVRAGSDGKISDDWINSRLTQSYTAGETLAIGDAVYLKATDGRVWKGSSTALNEALFSYVGVAAAVATAGNPVNVTVFGPATIPTVGAASTTISEAVDQSQTGSAASLITFDSTGKSCGIQFMTGDTVGNITAFELHVGKNATPGDVLTCNLYETQASGRETGSSLGSFTIANADVSNAAGTVVKKTLAATLKPRTRYLLRITYGTYVASNSFFLNGNSSLTTDFGWVNNSDSLSIGAGASLPYFKTYYTESRAWYANDNVYLNDTSGLIGVNEGTYRLKIGRILTATTIFVDPVDQEMPLGVSGVYLDSSGEKSSGTLKIPIPRNCRKIVIQQSGSINVTDNVPFSEIALVVKNFTAAISFSADSTGSSYTGGAAYTISGNKVVLTFGNGTSIPTSLRYLKWYWFK